MANLPISGLPALADLVDYLNDLLPIVDGGITKKFTADQFGLGGQTQTFSNRTTDLTLTNPIPCVSIVEINAPALSIILPSFAEKNSTRYMFGIYNNGQQNCTLKTSDGTGIFTINAGNFVFCYPKSNGTADPAISIYSFGTLSTQDANDVDIQGGTIVDTQVAGCQVGGGTLGSLIASVMTGVAYNTDIGSFVDFFEASPGDPATWSWDEPANGVLTWNGGEISHLRFLSYADISTATAQLGNIGLNGPSAIFTGVSTDLILSNPLAGWTQLEVTDPGLKVQLPPYNASNSSCRTVMIENLSTSTDSIDVYLFNGTQILDTLPIGCIMFVSTRDVTNANPSISDMSYKIFSSRGASPFNTSLSTAATVNMVANTYYVSARLAVSQVYVLPTSSSPGDIIQVTGFLTSLWKITQGNNQYIHCGSTPTTVGNTGSVTALNQFDSITLICIEENLGWVATAVVGNLSIN